MKPLPSSLQFETFAITDLGAQQLLADTLKATARFTAGDLVDDAIAASSLLDIVGDIAVISITGPLLRSDNFLSWLFGYATYDGIWQALEVATADKNIRAILLRIDSPGGVTNGLGELADFIAAVAGRMPVWVYVEGCCASAAYWLASQANRIVAYRTTESGCIGTRYGLVDEAGRDTLMGIKRHDLVNDQSPNKRGLPVDEDVIARIKVRLTDNAAEFIAAVTRGRKTDAETVIEQYGKGDVMIAEKALAVGMIDEISNFNSTLAALHAAVETNSPPARAQRGSMATTKDPKIVAAQAAAANGTVPDPKAATGQPAIVAGDDVTHPPWECKNCKEQMGPEADAFCGHCYTDAKAEEPDGDEDDDEAEGDGDEDAKALAPLGLLGKTRGETRANLIAFAKSTCRQLGATTATEAEGKAKAGMEAIAQLETARTTAVETAKTKAKADVLGAVEAALKGGKIAIADVGGLVDFVSNEQEGAKITAALNATMVDPKDAKKTIAVPQTLETVKAALSAASYDEKDARRITAYLAAKGSKLPSPHREPANTEASRRAVHQHLAATAPGQGIGTEQVSDFAHLTIAEIEAKVDADKKKASASNK